MKGRKSFKTSFENDSQLLNDIDLSINEWNKMCCDCLISGNIEEYRIKKNQISCLLEWRRQVLANNDNIVAKDFARNLIEARKQLDKSFSVPQLGENEDISSLSIPQVLSLHRTMQKRLIQGSFIPATVSEQYHFEEQHNVRESKANDITTNQLHLYFNMEASILKVQVKFKIYFSIWNKKTGYITDEFYISLNQGGLPENISLIGKLHTIFTDIKRENESIDNLYLVCKIYRVGALQLDQSSSPQSNFIRPFGCGIVSLSSIGLSDSIGRLIPHYLNIYRYHDTEKEFHKLPSAILERRNDNDLYRIPDYLSISLALLSGNIHNLQNPTISSHFESHELKEKLIDSIITPRYTQPDIVDIRDTRDEIYITLCHGNFSQGSKTKPRNIEITIRLFNEKGELIRNCLSRGTGKQIDNFDSYTSTIFYHENNPIYEETIRIDLKKVNDILNCHLLILISHCSSGQSATAAGNLRSALLGKGKKKERELIAFSFLPLKDRHTGVIAGVGDHYISCYQVTDENLAINLEKENFINPFYLSESTAKLNSMTPSSEEYLQLRICISSKKITVIQEVQELFSWNKITESELNLAILNCVNSDTADNLLTTIIPTSLTIISAKPNLMIPSYQLFIKVLVQYIKKRNDDLKKNSTIKHIHENSTSQYLQYLSGGISDTDDSLIEISDLISDLRNWIEPVFNSYSNLSVSLLQCIWDSIQTIGKVIPTSPSTALFRQNIFLTAPIVFKISLSYQQNVTNIQQQTQIMNFLRSITQHLSNLQPSDPHLYSLLRLVFYDIYRITLDNINDDELLSNIAINYISTLHSSSNLTVKAIKQDKYTFISHFIESEIFSHSITCRQLSILPIINVIKHHLLTDTYEIEPYTILLSLLNHLSYEETTLTNYLSQLYPALMTAIIRLLGGDLNKSTLRTRNSSIFNRRSSIQLSDIQKNPHIVSSIVVENAVCCLCSILKFTGKERFFLLLDSKNINNTSYNHNTSNTNNNTNNNNEEEYQVDEIRTYLPSFNGHNLLLSITLAFTLLLKRNIFPSSWLVLKLNYFGEISKFIEWTSNYLDLNKDTLQSPTELSNFWNSYFDYPIIDEELNVDPYQSMASNNFNKVNNLIFWSTLLNLSLYLILDPEISYESKNINPAKKEYLISKYSTFREPIKNSMLICWNSINFVLRIKFIHFFTIPILALTCNDNIILSSCGKDILTDILICDYSETKQFKLTSPFIYDCVCISVLNMTNIHIDSRYIPEKNLITSFLQNGLKKLFIESEILNTDDSLAFASEMGILLILLLNLSKYPQVLEYEEERTFAYQKLMAFFLNIGRNDSYLKTLHNLSKEMYLFENYIESGNLIRLHINSLKWSDIQLDSLDLGSDDVRDGIHIGLGILPHDTSSNRKILLINYTIQIYEKGSEYEKCLELLNELLNYYQNIIFDYTSVVTILAKQIEYYNKITLNDRYYSTMFRVGYYGMGINNELIRNREYIYKGSKLETIIEFTNKIKKKYENCELLSPKITPNNNEEYCNSEKGFIQISKVTPEYKDLKRINMISSLNSNSNTNTNSNSNEQLQEQKNEEGILQQLPGYVKNYELNNNLQYFYYQRPFRKRETKSANEFLDLWVEKRILKCESPFPNISRRSEIIHEERVIFNPIEMAVQMIQERNYDLNEKNKQLQSIADGQAGQSFTMTLSGTIDAAVNGGIKNYEGFITGEYQVNNPEIAEDVNSTPEKQQIIQKLKESLIEQVQLLEQGITLHKRKCLIEMKPLHDHLQKTFQKMKSEMNELLK